METAELIEKINDLTQDFYNEFLPSTRSINKNILKKLLHQINEIKSLIHEGLSHVSTVKDNELAYNLLGSLMDSASKLAHMEKRVKQTLTYFYLVTPHFLS